ncbi:MAG: RNB domain-containing ribonuclease [Treponema sp.]|jgi:exoribonuclease-2|nr:RNB domain-containing ribonuclease [Treponema sp.]
MQPRSLAIYKNRPALVTETDEKIRITTQNGEDLRVRPKDLQLLHPGPASLSELETLPKGDLRGAWELLQTEASFTLKEMAELAFDEWSPCSAWAAWLSLQEGLYFKGSADAVRCCSAGEIEKKEELKKREELESGERETFINMLKESLKNKTPLPAAIDRKTAERQLADVEALALGKSEKSRTLKELGREENPEWAHEVLLASGLWTPFVNPYPTRLGLNLSSPAAVPPPFPEEERIDLSALPAWAVDNSWSDDPDDALSWDFSGTKKILWVHVADPAASIGPEDPAEREARSRGSTLYLPEGVYRMLAQEILPVYALGLQKISPALSFKMTLGKEGGIEETEIFPSLVKVKRIDYAEADRLAAEDENWTALFRWAEQNEERRLDTGAVLIDFPEVHIHADIPDKKVSIESIPSRRSAEVIRECMILAGEGAAAWALRRQIPFPYIGQEEGGEFPRKRLEGLAGAFQIRRLMRPRSITTKPQVHWGLGLDHYSQVTSPLRRYTDLAAHQQIRAFLRKEPPLTEEELGRRLIEAEISAQTAAKAERASRLYWTAVYLSEQTGSSWEGIALEKKSGPGSHWAVYIPVLGLETSCALNRDTEPNEILKLKLSQVRIGSAKIVFIQE